MSYSDFLQIIRTAANEIDSTGYTYADGRGANMVLVEAGDVWVDRYRHLRR
jgi:hypothetical protein